MDFLKYLRSQSSDTKAYYALGAAGVVTSIVTLVWISTLPARFADITSKDNGIEDSSDITELVDGTKDQLGTVIDGFKKIKDIDTTTDIQTNNMDNLSREREETEQAPSAPIRPYDESNVKVTSAEVQKNAQNTAPRVILIATTTSQKTE